METTLVNKHSHLTPLVTVIHCHNGAAPLDLRVADYRVEIRVDWQPHHSH